MCEECKNLARSDYKLTNHHPNCSHYNDSLIDVWRVSCHGSSYYLETESEANQAAESEGSGDTVSIVKEKIHRELFDALPEFEGF